MRPLKILADSGVTAYPVLLAPLAGVSDHPVRRLCSRFGADLTYVEMISAAALLHDNRRTLQMMRRHESEARLGLQLTGRSAEEVAQAVERLDKMPYDTIDINMGCPVTKVVKTGCGSAALKDPERVLQTVKLCRQATAKPLSVKIRIGWDHSSINAVEIAQAVAAGGADWLTVHGRTRSDSYAAPVDLNVLASVKAAVTIPVIGNGNIFAPADVARMHAATAVDGVMVSRGALGDPWVFAFLKGRTAAVSIDEWAEVVTTHIDWHGEEYGNTEAAAVMLRKHLLWYSKGWVGGRKWRQQFGEVPNMDAAKTLVKDFHMWISNSGEPQRQPLNQEGEGPDRFAWDPKWQMDRQLDRGVGALS